MNPYSPLTTHLLNWYADHARTLPWRGHADPYAIWVSEIMLQQTRVETVIPYFKKWMELFPDIKSLAAASQEQVLSAWEGLGYYSRARSLQRAAQMIVAQYNGRLPEQGHALRRLPGIGAYTAGAIASIAFGADEPALDGNIRRVLARVFDVQEPARSPQGEQILWELAAVNLPSGKAGEYNQALMDLGATVCTPRSPNCAGCPLNELCQAYKLGIQEQRPVRSARPEIPHYTVAAAVIQRNGHVLITRRPEKGLLGGMWEFPGGKLQENEDLIACLRREIQEELGVGVRVTDPLGVYRHAYTHFRVTLHAFRCSLEEGEPRPIEASDLRWVAPSDLQGFPMGKIDRQIAQDIS
ncbi:MAG: A/G-specific adenine glycosylase [Anaerolineales bacterium]|jgi:A/G-specific adenine glycosylase